MNSKILGILVALGAVFIIIFWGALVSGNLTEDSKGNVHIDTKSTAKTK